jgi:NAD(P)-dependent dehydrogenase (short-subunit alcohol dehydrogenase family)
VIAVLLCEKWADQDFSRFGTPEQIGEAVVLLLSDKLGGMGWMTGSDVVIDGGYTLH